MFTVAGLFPLKPKRCLKYKDEEKPKTGPRTGLRLNYDVNIGPKT